MIDEAYKQSQSEKIEIQKKETSEESNDLQETLEQKIEQAKKTGFLSLKGQNIQQLNENITSLDNVHTLILSNNPLKNLNLGNMTNLKTIYCVNCHLYDHSIDNSFFDLNLEEIYFQKNNLTKLDSFSKFKHLKKLDLSHNQIIQIPDSIQNLAELQQLNLSYNNITDLPKALGCLPQLKSLKLQHNNLDEELMKRIKEEPLDQLKSFIQQQA